ncbi:FAD-binding protein [candidate division KSB3 bacterium]|uniref:FAD-binding protein n=1 Tax=candidate division KSB3 bacterium TaxID=2044937 RepID=A0A9D5JT26_9BACT|nr:FAD-binding protein [candidate division KSB3 bacterium]MBD3323496.1 FAD-binding protein [candidate division KSB3 bacterium]
MLDHKVRTTTNGNTVLSEKLIEEFTANLSGQLLCHGDEDYEEQRNVWNGMIDKHPALIVRCANVNDVVQAVNFARNNDLLVAVRGGGHNVAGTALCDDGLVIDLSLMKKVEVDPDARTAVAQGGATIADLDAATQPHGLAAPMGVVSQTGIAGLTLGGGIGWLRRKYGLSSDNVLSFELVTADGRVLNVSKNEHPDLFWGLRGGGGNFGVVTAFEYQLHPVSPEVMFVFVLYHASKMQEVLRSYRDYCATAPDEVSSFMIAGNVPSSEDFPPEIHGEPFVLFGACYAGSVEEGQQVLQPLREFAEPMVDASGPMPYTDVQTILDAEFPDGFHYYWKSLYLDSLDDPVIDGVAACNEQRPSPLSTVDIWQMGGAISRFSEDDSAVGSRDAPYLLGIEANWDPSEDDDANIAWARKCIADMQPFSNGRQYLNFPGFLEDQEQTMRTTFDNRYERLVALKNKYDPTNFFRLNHNIKPSS